MRKALLLGVPLVFFSAACTYDNGDAQRVTATPVACDSPAEPATSTIDADRQIEVDPGQGAGVFIEYGAGGHWTLRTSCDTDKTNTAYSWDVIVTPEDGQALSLVTPYDFEPGDTVNPFSTDGSYRFLAATSSDIDGITFDSAPGAAVRVDSYLDGVCALPYFFWVGDGALHQTSPTNPLILIPSVP